VSGTTRLDHPVGDRRRSPWRYRPTACVSSGRYSTEVGDRGAAYESTPSNKRMNPTKPAQAMELRGLSLCWADRRVSMLHANLPAVWASDWSRYGGYHSPTCCSRRDERWSLRPGPCCVPGGLPGPWVFSSRVDKSHRRCNCGGRPLGQEPAIASPNDLPPSRRSEGRQAHSPPIGGHAGASCVDARGRERAAQQ
jgi:hypothetical protein